MLRSVFGFAIWARRKAMAWWGASSFAYMLMYGSVYPTVRENAADFDELLQGYPEALKKMFGVTDDFSYASGDGFMQVQLFSLVVPLVFLIFAIGIGSRIIAGEEEDGVLDLLLSGPITRRSVLLQKFGAMALLTTGLGMVVLAALLATNEIAGIGVSIMRLAEGILGSLLLSLVFGAAALAVGAVTGRRGLAIGAASGFVAASYLMYTLAGLADSLGTVQRAFPWYYYAAAQPLRNGLNWVHTGVLVAIVLVLVLAALAVFERRDIAV